MIISYWLLFPISIRLVCHLQLWVSPHHNWKFSMSEHFDFDSNSQRKHIWITYVDCPNVLCRINMTLDNTTLSTYVSSKWHDTIQNDTKIFFLTIIHCYWRFLSNICTNFCFYSLKKIKTNVFHFVSCHIKLCCIV